MVPGTAVAASTTRRNTPHLASLTLKAPMGRLLGPRSSQWAFDTFGEQVRQPFVVYAEWPAGNTEHLPIQQGDTLIITGTGEKLAVFGVKAHAGIYLQLGVQVKPE